MKTKTLKVLESYVKEFIFSKTRGFRKVYLHLWCWGYSWAFKFLEWSGGYSGAFSAFCYGCFLETQTSVSDYGVNYCRVGLLPDSIFCKKRRFCGFTQHIYWFLANTNGLEQDLSRYFANNGLWATLEHFFKLIPYVTAFYIELLGLLPLLWP